MKYKEIRILGASGGLTIIKVAHDYAGMPCPINNCWQVTDINGNVWSFNWNTHISRILVVNSEIKETESK